MEYVIIIITIIVVLGYAFRIDQWDMWKTKKWVTVKRFEATGEYGNVFKTNKVSVIVKIEKTTNLKVNIIRGRVNYGHGWGFYDLDKMYIEIPDIRKDLEDNGFKL